MMARSSFPKEMDLYIKGFPPGVRGILERVRRDMRKVAPGCKESISYDMPALMLRGRHFVAFAGWKNHMSIYPIPGGSASLGKKMLPFRVGKGTLQFPLHEPIPHGLIADVTRALLKEQIARLRVRDRNKAWLAAWRG